MRWAEILRALLWPLICRASACLGVSLRTAELWQRAGVYRPVRASCVTSADDALMMIMLSTSLRAASGGALLRGHPGVLIGRSLGYEQFRCAFVWDEQESEALRQAHKEAELTLFADSVRAYLKRAASTGTRHANRY